VPAQRVSYQTGVRSFDHERLVRHPACATLRQALSDLGNQISEAGEGMLLGEFPGAVRGTWLLPRRAECAGCGCPVLEHGEREPRACHECGQCAAYVNGARL
jgi:hypothetical protein